MSIRPLHNFVLVEFRSKSGILVMPQGKRSPDSHVVVVAVGPDVPEEAGLEEGTKVLLRGDAKIFGVDDTNKQACVEFTTIMAIQDDLLTDAEIDAAIASN